MPETKNSILRVGERSAVLGIRVGVPHLTKFDVGEVRHWKGGFYIGCVLMRNVSRGDRHPRVYSCNKACCYCISCY